MLSNSGHPTFTPNVAAAGTSSKVENEPKPTKKRSHSFTSRNSIAVHPVRIIENGIVVGCSNEKQQLWDRLIDTIQHPQQTIDDITIILDLLHYNDNNERQGKEVEEDVEVDVWNLLRDFQLLVDPYSGYVYHLDMDRPFEPIEVGMSSIIEYMNICSNNNNNNNNNEGDEHDDDDDDETAIAATATTDKNNDNNENDDDDDDNNKEKVLNAAQIQRTSTCFQNHRVRCTTLLENVLERLKDKSKGQS